MLSKIHHWTAKLLSYGGRLQLVQSVLYAVQNFWSQLLPFPKKVMKCIDAICRQYLWSGDVGGKRAPVAWDDVCRSRAEGGLNLVHLPTWNKACMLKLLWAIHHKSDKLWIQWIHSYYIKQQQIDVMVVPLQASYLFKKLLKYRDEIAHLQIRDDILGMEEFHMRAVYRLLRPALPRQPWSGLVMRNLATPRAKFVFWLAARRRLATKDRLQQFCDIPDPSCVFCHVVSESIDHLFFSCSHIRAAWEALLHWFGMPLIHGDWHDLLPQLVACTKGDRAGPRLLKVLITEFVYALWIERNRRIFMDGVEDMQRILRSVVQKAIGRCLVNSKLVPLCRSYMGYPVL